MCIRGYALEECELSPTSLHVHVCVNYAYISRVLLTSDSLVWGCGDLLKSVKSENKKKRRARRNRIIIAPGISHIQNNSDPNGACR